MIDRWLPNLDCASCRSMRRSDNTESTSLLELPVSGRFNWHACKWAMVSSINLI